MISRMTSGWASARQLDAVTRLLSEKGIEASRHAYSYRLLYRGAIVASIHLYPGYEEASVRLYRAYPSLAREALDIIIWVLKKVFPNYTITVSWYPPPMG